jgi:hypothetical protein
LVKVNDQGVTPVELLKPSDIEMEQPKSPWTPSYSVMTQGPEIGQAVDAEQLPVTNEPEIAQDEHPVDHLPQTVHVPDEVCRL